MHAAVFYHLSVFAKGKMNEEAFWVMVNVTPTWVNLGANRKGDTSIS